MLKMEVLFEIVITCHHLSNIIIKIKNSHTFIIYPFHQFGRVEIVNFNFAYTSNVLHTIDRMEGSN